jgi:anti-sigma factor ChrR (cupin superfamily)
MNSAVVKLLGGGRVKNFGNTVVTPSRWALEGGRFTPVTRGYQPSCDVTMAKRPSRTVLDRNGA